MAPIIDPINDAINAMVKPSYNPHDSIYADPANERTNSDGIGDIKDCKIIAKISPTGPNSIVRS
jgi:hypothetical protein